MQRIFTLCTMLLTVFEALSRELPTSQMSSEGDLGAWGPATNGTCSWRTRAARERLRRSQKEHLTMGSPHSESDLLGKGKKTWSSVSGFSHRLFPSCPVDTPLKNKQRRRSDVNVVSECLRSRLLGLAEAETSPVDRKYRGSAAFGAVLPLRRPRFSRRNFEGGCRRSRVAASSYDRVPSPLFRDEGLTAGEDRQSGNGKDEESDAFDSRGDLQKLRRMLDEVRSMLRDRNIEADAGLANPKDGSSRAATDSIRSKIDKLAIPILTQISEELSSESKKGAGKRVSQKASKCTEKKDRSGKSDGGCSLDGVWCSNVAGSELNMTVLPSMILKVTAGAGKKNAFLDKKWFVQGLTLSKNGGPFMLAAVCPQKKRLASFIGQCKVYREEELISGMWTISSGTPECGDLWTSVETRTDVLKRKRQKATR